PRRGHESAQSVALHVVHHQVDPRVVSSHIERRHDVRMANARREAGLVEEILVTGRDAQVGMDELDGHLALEIEARADLREIDRGHASGAEREEQVVSPHATGVRVERAGCTHHGSSPARALRSWKYRRAIPLTWAAWRTL